MRADGLLQRCFTWVRLALVIVLLVGIAAITVIAMLEGVEVA
jgi:hypothetical protein